MSHYCLPLWSNRFPSLADFIPNMCEHSIDSSLYSNTLSFALVLVFKTCHTPYETEPRLTHLITGLEYHVCMKSKLLYNHTSSSSRDTACLLQSNGNISPCETNMTLAETTIKLYYSLDLLFYSHNSKLDRLRETGKGARRLPRVIAYSIALHTLYSTSTKVRSKKLITGLIIHSNYHGTKCTMYDVFAWV